MVNLNTGVWQDTSRATRPSCVQRGRGRTGHQLLAWVGHNTPNPDQVAFPASWYRCQRHPHPDLVLFEKRPSPIFIEGARGQQELDDAGEVLGEHVRSEDRGRVEHRADDVVGPVTGRIVPYELTDLTIVLLSSYVMAAC